MHKISKILQIIFVTAFAVAPTTASASMSAKLWKKIDQHDLQIIKKISADLKNKNYEEALKQAKLLQDEVSAEGQVKLGFSESLKDIILWNKYSNKIDAHGISFNDISRFVNDNKFYPNYKEMQRNAEKVAIANDIPYQASEQYFKTNPANTTESKIYLLKAKIDFLSRKNLTEQERVKANQDLRALISEIWIKENFSLVEEENFLAKYQQQLNEIDHIARIDRLLWDGKITEANRIMNLLTNDDYKKLFTAIIEIEKKPKYIDRIVLEVPRKLRAHENLTYHRIMWHKAHDDKDEAIDLMEDLPKNSQFAEKWWNLRRLYGRELLKSKKYSAAYKIVSAHNLPFASANYWEAEWTTGWIALRFLDEPKVAFKHFQSLQSNVTQAVTLARADYWLGMAAQADGDRVEAIKWYKEATKYPIFFYGQLAIHKHRLLDSVSAQDDIILPKDPDITGKDMTTIANLKAAQVAYLLALTGDKDNAGKIFDWIVNNAKSDGEIAVVMKIINEIGDRALDAKVSRTAAKRNVFFIKDKFQIVKEVEGDAYAPLVHAIIKQESGFVVSAMSNVGAIGFMQLMPATAKLVAKDLGIKYNKHKLAYDIKYNITLGSHYIKQLIDRFDGSEMLAIASYNAGPNATQRWINEFYDPRKAKDLDKVVDWIELITYSETRNYVQRIMENLIVYKYLMSRSNYDQIK